VSVCLERERREEGREGRTEEKEAIVRNAILIDNVYYAF